MRFARGRQGRGGVSSVRGCGVRVSGWGHAPQGRVPRVSRGPPLAAELEFVEITIIVVVVMVMVVVITCLLSHYKLSARSFLGRHSQGRRREDALSSVSAHPALCTCNAGRGGGGRPGGPLGTAGRETAWGGVWGRAVQPQAVAQVREAVDATTQQGSGPPSSWKRARALLAGGLQARLTPPSTVPPFTGQVSAEPFCVSRTLPGGRSPPPQGCCLVHWV